GEAEFGGPALNVRPEPVALADLLVGGGVGQDHGGNGGVASRVRPGTQDTCHPFRLGACRAVWGVWSLVMVVSLMVRVTVRLPGRVRGRGGLCRPAGPETGRLRRKGRGR